MVTKFYRFVLAVIVGLLFAQPAYAQLPYEPVQSLHTLDRGLETGKNPTNMPYKPVDDWTSVDELVNYAAYTIDYYWQAEFQKAGLSYTSPQIFGYYTQPLQLACGPTSMSNASFCPADYSLTYDYFFLDAQWKQHGDFAPVIIIAHEWGHLVQAHFDLLGNQLSELQADCLAGAYTQAAAQWGLLEPGDLQEGAASLFNAGNPNTPWFDHGTPEQRVQAFEFGLSYGIGPCFQDYASGHSGNAGTSNFSGTVNKLYLPVIAK